MDIGIHINISIINDMIYSPPPMFSSSFMQMCECIYVCVRAGVCVCVRVRLCVPVETGMRICWTGMEGLPELAPATAACWLRKN